MLSRLFNLPLRLPTLRLPVWHQNRFRHFHNYITIQEIYARLTKMWQKTSEGFKVMNVEMLPDYPYTEQSQLVPRTFKDSYCEALLPLRHNKELEDKYLNGYGGVRIGRIFEDLDVFAVHIAFSHVQPIVDELGGPPFSIVTALVDHIDVTSSSAIVRNRDVKFTGQVTWSGQSSIEVTMNVLQENAQILQFDHVLLARFVMVARNCKTGKSAVVNPLIPETDHEKAIIAKANERVAWRKGLSQQSLLRNTPAPKEMVLLHDIFNRTRENKASLSSPLILPEYSAWMKDFVMSNFIICQPEARNMYMKVFGGFLMRQAYELGWSVASVFLQSRPSFVAVDDIVFHQPVSVGDLLNLTARVVYTKGRYVQVMVIAETVDVRTQKRETTDAFHFTFKPLDEKLEKVKNVIPQTYIESMLLLDGKRHFEKVMSYKMEK